MSRIIYSEPVCDMFFPTEISDVQDSIQNYVVEMGECLKQANNFEEEYSYNLSKPEIDDVLLYGRLYSSQIGDFDGKFSLKNCILSLPSHFNREFVNLIFPPTISNLFRGEIIAVSGRYSNGTVFVSNVFTNCRINEPLQISSNFSTLITICAGEYVDNSLDSAKELNEKIVSIKPEKCIFLGPICTTECNILHDKSNEGPIETADTLTKILIQTLSESLNECIFVASPYDACGLPIIPSPRIEESNLTSICTGNPCQIQIGELSLYCLSYDSMNAISKQCDGEVDGSILHEQCNGLPTLVPGLIQNNIQEMKTKTTPHIFAILGKEPKITEYNGSYTITIPEWIQKRKIAVIKVKNGNISISFI